MTRWKLTNELFGNDKDLLIWKTLERIEDDEELEHVYELLAHVPRQHLVEYVTTGLSDDRISELIDQKIISATEARVWGDYDR